MGYIVPPRPGEKPDPWIERGLRIQIAIWLIALPVLAVLLPFVFLGWAYR